MDTVKKMTLAQANGTLLKLVAHEKMYADRSKVQRQFQVTIPLPIGELMLSRTDAWRWYVTDEGVLLKPVDTAEKPSLPAWSQNGTP